MREKRVGESLGHGKGSGSEGITGVSDDPGLTIGQVPDQRNALEPEEGADILKRFMDFIVDPIRRQSDKSCGKVGQQDLKLEAFSKPRILDALCFAAVIYGSFLKLGND
jgi:hypothetical protein